MSRLLATVREDVRVQYRQRFYLATAFVLIVMIGVLRQLPPAELPWLLPLLVLSSVETNTFYFLAGLLLLEKNEGTLQAQVVTPLRIGEYLGSKVLTLTVLSMVESLILTGAVIGTRFSPLPLLTGVALTSVVFCLAGFLVVVRYDSINEYLMPSVVYTTLLALPLLPFFDVVHSPLFRLHPVDPGWRMIVAGFDPSAPMSWSLAAASGAVWIVAGWLLCRRAFVKFFITCAGARLG